MSDGEWFAPKRVGYGSGLPIAWQGWAVLAAYLVAVAGCWMLRERHERLALVLCLIATAVLMVIAARHTRGGWRWRTGGEDA